MTRDLTKSGDGAWAQRMARAGALAVLLSASAVAVPALAHASERAVALVIDCGPEDTEYLSGASEDAGAGEFGWVPVDGSLRSSAWTSQAPQYFDYVVRTGLRPGPYEIKAWVCVQKQYRLSLSLLVDGERVAGPTVSENPGPKGYIPFALAARVQIRSLPLRLRLAADALPRGDRIRAVRIELLDLRRLTGDGNVARSATVRVSSCLDPGEYPVSALNDGWREYRGTTRRRSWASEETRADHWVELVFVEPERIDRAVIYSPLYPDVYNTPRRVFAQVPEGEDWRTIGAVDTPAPMPRRECRFPAIETSRLRLLMPAGMGRAQRPDIFWLNEVEVWRAGLPPVAAPRASARLSWSRRERPELVSPLAGGTGPGEMLTILCTSGACGPPRVDDVTPDSLRAGLRWWWDGQDLAEAGPTAGRRHRLVWAPKTAGAVAVDTLTLTVPGDCEILAPDDVRVTPRAYRMTARMSDAEFFDALDLAKPGLEAVAAAVAARDLVSARLRFVEHVRSETHPRPRVRRPTVARPDDEPPDQEAERFRRHEWYFYKHREWRPLGPVINWYLPDGDGSDRHYIARLGLLRYMVDRWEREKDDSWAIAWTRIFRQFYENAPSPRAPPVFPASHLPWCGLCSAIRIRGVLEDHFRMIDSPVLSVDDHMRVCKSALEHGRFLAECDGGRFFAANHQMGHLVALEQIAATFPEMRETAEWRLLLQRLLNEHLRRDTFADGGSVDTATGYGIYVATGLFTDAYLYAEAAGIALSSDWRGRLERMFEWCLKVGAPDGGHLAIGDANLRLDCESNRFGASLVGFMGALLFRRPDFLWFAGRPGCHQLSPSRRQAVARELSGRDWRESLAAVNDLVPREPAFLSVSLPDTGWTILRSDWSPRAVYMFVNHHRGGHTHRTQNDINVVAFGRHFITDPGIPHTYVTKRWQDWYVTTRAHNTVLVDGKDMSAGPGGRGSFFSSGPVDYLRVAHDRYREAGIETHERSVLYIKDRLFVVDDSLRGTGTHQFAWLAHFQPMVVETDRVHGRVLAGGEDGRPGLLLAAADPGTLSLHRATGWTNVPSRQVCEEVPDAPYVSFEKATESPAGFGVAVAVAPEGLPEASIESRPVEGGQGVGAAYRVEWEGGVCEAVFRHGTSERRTYGSIASDGAAAAVVEGRDGSRTLFLGSGTELISRLGALRLVGGRGSVAVRAAAGSASVWVEGDAVALRLRWPDILRVDLAGRPVPLTRDGEEVIVPLGTTQRE